MATDATQQQDTKVRLLQKEILRTLTTKSNCEKYHRKYYQRDATQRQDA